MEEKVILLEYFFGTVFHEDGVEEDACYIYAAWADKKKVEENGLETDITYVSTFEKREGREGVERGVSFWKYLSEQEPTEKDKIALVREARRWFEKGERSCWSVLKEMGEER